MLYKSKILTLVTMVYSWYVISIVLLAQVVIFTHVVSDDVDDWDRWFLGRAPRTRETLPYFHESCRVARHSRVFRGLTDSQRTPGILGVTIEMSAKQEITPQDPFQEETNDVDEFSLPVENDTILLNDLKGEMLDIDVTETLPHDDDKEEEYDEDEDEEEEWNDLNSED